MRIIVVGAGVLGASVAFHLVQSGVDVIVIEPRLAGRATQAGAGIICPWLSETGDAMFSSLYEGGARYYPELIRFLGDADEVGYRRSGALYVSAVPGEIADVERLLASRAKRTPEIGSVERLSPCRAQQLFPPLAPDLSAIHIGGAARVDGRKLAATLLAHATRLGMKLVSGAATLAWRGRTVVGVHCNGELLEADLVAATNGAWGAEFLRPLGIALPIAPQRGQILHLELPNHDTSGWPVVLPNGSHYLLAFEGGRIVAGATRENGTGFDYRVTAAGQVELLVEALRVAPGLRSATVVETRIGFRPAPPGLRPLLGHVRGIEGLVVGNGLGAGGLTMGPYVGKLLAEAILGKPSFDLAPFDPLRPDFQTGPALR